MCRQRQRRNCVIEALVWGGLERTLKFDASCTDRQIPGCVRLLAAQAAGLACRDPQEFKDDKRGRSHQVFDSILEGAGSGNDDSRSTDGYAGIEAEGPPRRIEAHRTAMPGNACAVPLCNWLCPSLSESSNSPYSSDAETAKEGFYFGADPVQLRACLRRMARARLLRVLPSRTGSQRLVPGAFPVAEDHRDRFIGDRRRQKEKERLIHRACLPYAPCSKMVTRFGPTSEMFAIVFTSLKWTTSASRDRSSGLGCLKAGSVILKTSPRISCRPSAFKPWLSSDLTNPSDEPNHAPGYVQVAIAGIMIGSFCLVEPSLAAVSVVPTRARGTLTSTTSQCSPWSRRPAVPLPRINRA